MRQSGEKRISCKRCQTRKIKCSRTTPCRNCSVAGADCEFRAHDWKRSPISREHVTALEARIVALESLLSGIRSSRGREPEMIIGSIDIVGHQPRDTDKVQASVHMNDHFLRGMRGVWGGNRTASMCFYGPGSAFSTGLLRFDEPESEILDPQGVRTTNISDVSVQVLQHCVELFFKWQYPYCNLIDRDQLLREYFSGGELSENYAPLLLNAVCSLGALMSASQYIRSLARVFSAAVEEEISSEFWKPRVATSQAMLLLAVFEAGRGGFAKAWTYSGMAFRMAHQLGIHEYNSLPSREDFQSTSSKGLESWRRMYLTYAISDKMFSLFFGRPSTMNKIGNAFHAEMSNRSNSNFAEGFEKRQNPSVLMSDTLLDSQGSQLLEDPERTVDTAVLIRLQGELGNIIQDIQTQTLDSSHELHSAAECWIEAIYRELNARLWNWHDTLPGEMRWNRWSSRKRDVDPGLVHLHVLFHTVRISLNSPLLSQAGTRRPPPLQIPEIVSEAFNVCEVSVETIVQIIERFRSWQTLRPAPFLCVHGVITAVDAIVAIISCSWMEEARSRVINAGLLPKLDAALNDLSQTWPAAQEARSRLHEILNTRQLGLGPMNETLSSGVSMFTTDGWPEMLDHDAANPEPMHLPPSQGVSGTLHTFQSQASLFPEYLISASLDDVSEALDIEYSFNSASWNPSATSESSIAFHPSTMHL